MFIRSEIGKWNKEAIIRKSKFDRTGNIHDFIDYKKKCWLIEGYNECLRVICCDVEQLSDDDLRDQYNMFHRELLNRGIEVER